MSFGCHAFGTRPFGLPAPTAPAEGTALSGAAIAVATATADLTVPLPGSVTLTEIGARRVIQRRVNTNNAGVTLTGVYTGTPAAIEARVVADVGGAEVVAWTTIDAAPTGGVFSGTLTVPQGGWYQAEVRFSNATAVTDATAGKWGVGITCLCIGQSNIAHWFDVGTSTSPALAAKHTGAQYPSTSGAWSEIGTTAQGAAAFANELISTYGIPVGLFAYAVGGTRIFDWASLTNDLYRNPRKAVQDEGGAVEYVLWVQGERDAVLGTSQSSYETSFANLVTNLRNDIDPAAGISELPILVSLLGRGAVANLVSDANGAAIRAAQRNAIAAHTSVYLAATTTDLDLSDGVHYTAAEYTRHAARMAQTIRYLRGNATYHRGPAATEVLQIDTTTVDVRVTHRGGSDLSPSTGMAGFEVLDGGVPVTPVAAVRQDASTIRLTVAASLSGPVGVRYMYGIDGGVTYADAYTGEVVDNTALTLPLESFDGLMVAAQFVGAAQASATATGTLTAQIRLSGAALAQALAAAGLTTGIPLAGAATGAATASGDLGGGAAALAAAAQAVASGSATLTTHITLQGAALAAALANATLTTGGSGLAATAQASAQAAGNLTTAIRLSAAALAQAAASGSLEISVPLNGTAVTQALASGALFTAIRLSGAANASAFATAALTGGTADAITRHGPCAGGFGAQQSTLRRSASRSTLRRTPS